MKKLKPRIKICKVPGCHKETFTDKSVFCGEHERVFNSSVKTAEKAAMLVGSLVLTSLVGKSKK